MGSGEGFFPPATLYGGYREDRIGFQSFHRVKALDTVILLSMLFNSWSLLLVTGKVPIHPIQNHSNVCCILSAWMGLK